jgi:hypothetical protein
MSVSNMAGLLRTKEQNEFNFTDPHWRPFPQEKLDALGVTPNQLWANSSSTAGALVVKKSASYPEYALSKAGLDYLHAAEQAGKITSGYVVLVKWDTGKLVVVQIKPVAEVVAGLAGIPPRDGPFGPYWWLNADLTPHGARPLPDGEVPF